MATKYLTTLGESLAPILYYAQDAEPTLPANNMLAIWKDTNDGNRIYFIFRRGAADQVKVELT